jgi:hypothetical protein
MISLKREKILGFVMTAIAMVFFLAFDSLLIAYAVIQETPISIETGTLMALQTLAFLFLFFGMLFRKTNLVIGTLVGALVASVVSFLVDDIEGWIKEPPDLSGAWYLSSYPFLSLIQDAFLSLGVIFFLIYLFNGHRKITQRLATVFFLLYLVTAFLTLVILLIGAVSESKVWIYFLSTGANSIATLAYLLDINVYFFRKKDVTAYSIPKAAVSKDAKETKQEALDHVDDVIADYQKGILSSAFEEKDGHLILTVDLRNGPLYEGFSGNTLLDGAIYAFVEDVTFALSNGQELALCFLFPEGMSEDEKAKVKKIFKAHYALAYKNLRDKLTKEMVLAITFIFIGFLLITLHLPYVNANGDSVYGEMLDIFGWVFAWEAIEILCVNAFDNQTELERYRSLYLAKTVDGKKPG